ncbi:hypothetical protein [Shouchella miscanthi]|uniref:hypothetical protein n=1 Tax=Shouchella miscanthi TaxID=2598861 RepID=UPI00119DF2AD|nr:hypothetical protein [Shouchella miscanthi]
MEFKKLGFSMFVIPVCILSGGLIAQASNDYENIETPEQYEDYLKDHMSESFFRADFDFHMQQDAQKTLNDFQSLSAAEQQQFVDYVMSPDVFLEISEALSSIKIDENGNGNTSLYNGDITIGVESDIAPSTRNRQAHSLTHAVTSDYLGVDVVRVSTTLNFTGYAVDGDGCCYVDEDTMQANSSIQRNWLPLSSYNAVTSDPWTSNGGIQINGETVWEISFIHTNIGATIANWKHTYWAPGTGTGMHGEVSASF